MRSFDALLACPRCRGRLSRRDAVLRCAPCAAEYGSPGGIPALTVSSCGSNASDAATEKVRDFYAAAPFPNYPPSPRDSLSALRARASKSEFARRLDEAIPGDAVVAEIGCGTGQLALFLASADRVVVGADLTRPSLELARDAARRYGAADVLFVETDLRSPGLAEEAFDVVVCSGVLHHTPDPRRSFASVARLVRPGGVLVLGVYNSVARLPTRLRRVAARLTGYRWIPADPVLDARSLEPSRREAWLRDQYRHPEEHRHTLGEVKEWFRENGLQYLRAFPSALLGQSDEDDARPGDPDLFVQAEDDWSLEEWLAQFSWIGSLGGEGGLFVTVGCRPI